MKKRLLVLAAILFPIAGHGVMAISGNEEAKFFLHWSMLVAVLIGSGLGILIIRGFAALRSKHDICEDLLCVMTLKKRRKGNLELFEPIFHCIQL